MKSRPRSLLLDSESLRIFRKVSDALNAYAQKGVPLERWRAAAYAKQLRRLIRRPRALPNPGQIKEREAGLNYRMRLTLDKGKRPRQGWKRISIEVKNIYGYESARWVVSAATRHKAWINDWLSRLDSNADYAGLTQRQMFERELAQLYGKRTQEP